MELVSVDNSRIIFLTQVHRPAGQLYFPDAVGKLVNRYSFLKAPAPDQATHPFVFGLGKFEDAQITELSLYPDGFIVSSASDTDIIDAFIRDLMSWAESDLGLVPMPGSKTETFYESSIVIKSKVDLSLALQPEIDDLAGTLAGALKSAGITRSLKLSGFLLDFDPDDFKGKRKPFRLLVDRRVGIPFSDDLFFSQGPFRTKDHLNVLRSFETLALRHDGVPPGRRREGR
jgi:hypothetical protein